MWFNYFNSIINNQIVVCLASECCLDFLYSPLIQLLYRSTDCYVSRKNTLNYVMNTNYP